MKKICLLLTAVIFIACTACSDSATSDNKYVQMVKNGYRTDNPDLTYGKAFSDFFGTPRWSYFKGEDGQDVVEFTGDCTYQDVAVKALIQFVVDEENGTFEATYLSFNDVPQVMLILAALIEKAFESSETLNENNAQSTDLTEEDALIIAQQFLDEHPLYKRTITGEVEYEPDDDYDYDIIGLYRIGLVADDGSSRTMWVNKQTGKVFISPDGFILLTGEEYYDTVFLNPVSDSTEKATEPTEAKKTSLLDWNTMTGSQKADLNEFMSIFSELDFCSDGSGGYSYSSVLKAFEGNYMQKEPHITDYFYFGLKYNIFYNSEETESFEIPESEYYYYGGIKAENISKAVEMFFSVDFLTAEDYIGLVDQKNIYDPNYIFKTYNDEYVLLPITDIFPVYFSQVDYVTEISYDTYSVSGKIYTELEYMDNRYIPFNANTAAMAETEGEFSAVVRANENGSYTLIEYLPSYYY